MIAKPIAVVTGASGALGSEICNLVAGRGIDLIAIDRTPDRARALARTLVVRYPGVAVDAFAVDLADRADIARVTAEIVAKYSRIDYLFNNAGVLTETLTFSKYGTELHFEVNALAPLEMIDGLRAALARAGGAHVVNTSAGISLGEKTLAWDDLVTPKTFSKLFGPYTRSKAALNVLTAALGEELAPDRIVVRAADPGPTKSALTRGAGTPLWMRAFYFALPSAAKSARKIFDAADSTKWEARSGVLITGGRVAALPPALAAPTFARDFLARCRALARQAGT